MIQVWSSSSREGLCFHGHLPFGLLFRSLGLFLAEFCQRWFPPVHVLGCDGNPVVGSSSSLLPSRLYSLSSLFCGMVGFLFHCKGPMGLSLTLIFIPGVEWNNCELYFPFCGLKRIGCY